MRGLFIPNMELPKKNRWAVVTIYDDGRVVYHFGGREIGVAEVVEKEDECTTTT